MLTTGLEDKVNKFGNSYNIVLLAAERAKQLQQGAAPLLKTGSTHPLTIAMEEISAGLYPPAARDSSNGAGDTDEAARLSPALPEIEDALEGEDDDADESEEEEEE